MRSFETAPPDVQELLRKPIKDLGLKLEGSPLEPYMHRLYAELARKKLAHFRPACYLTDEWGCPSGEPVIGVPFYLADEKLAALEKHVNELEGPREIMMYMRHEAGHAFNYAYELYKTEEWRALFGPFRRPYKELYKSEPFSKKFVRHIPGWYAQKHPDEDFAECFAVWLTPRSKWREKYRGWPALPKLQYVERITRAVRDTAPIRVIGTTDITVEEMETTIEEYYRLYEPTDAQAISALPLATDLADIFSAMRKKNERRATRPAAEMIAENRSAIIDTVAYWTGLTRPLVRRLVESIEEQVAGNAFTVEKRHESARLVQITGYATTLALTFVTRGKGTP